MGKDYEIQTAFKYKHIYNEYRSSFKMVEIINIKK